MILCTLGLFFTVKETHADGVTIGATEFTIIRKDGNNEATRSPFPILFSQNVRI